MHKVDNVLDSLRGLNYVHEDVLSSDYGCLGYCGRGRVQIVFQGVHNGFWVLVYLV